MNRAQRVTTDRLDSHISAGNILYNLMGPGGTSGAGPINTDYLIARSLLDDNITIANGGAWSEKEKGHTFGRLAELLREHGAKKRLKHNEPMWDLLLIWSGIVPYIRDSQHTWRDELIEQDQWPQTTNLWPERNLHPLPNCISCCSQWTTGFPAGISSSFFCTDKDSQASGSRSLTWLSLRAYPSYKQNL